VTWTVGAVDHEFLGFTPVTAKELIGTVDNSAYPAISVKIHAIEVLPGCGEGEGSGADSCLGRRGSRARMSRGVRNWRS